MDILRSIEENALLVYISVLKLVESLHLSGCVQDGHKDAFLRRLAQHAVPGHSSCPTSKPGLKIPNTSAF